MNKTTFFSFAVLAVMSISLMSSEPIAKTSNIVAESSAVALSKAQQLAAAVPGLSTDFINKAIKGFENMVASGLIKNSKYLTLVDMSRSSREKRFYIIDVEKDSVVMNTYVSHGKNSGLDMAESFSNEMNSEKSSLGFYVTGETYKGKHGESLRLRGVDSGYNDMAEQRGVVVHAADYVNEGRVNSAYMGRSQGCPALPNDKIAEAINYMKGGSALFIYNGDQNYAANSQMLR